MTAATVAPDHARPPLTCAAAGAVTGSSRHRVDLDRAGVAHDAGDGRACRRLVSRMWTTAGPSSVAGGRLAVGTG